MNDARQTALERLAAVRETLPDWLDETLVALLAAAIGVLVALLAYRIGMGALQRLAKLSESESDDALLRRIARPVKWSFVALGLVMAARVTPALSGIWEAVAGFVVPGLIGWVAIAIMQALLGAISERQDISVLDNARARRRRTRLQIFSRIGTFVIVFITIGLMLLSIPGVRQVGVTLVASAGLASLAVAAAAQPALKSLISGLQMALTEPIAIDDMVKIEGEVGVVEDIRTSYVIVRTWDERRLIVPCIKFLEDTFENWTKRGAQVTGVAFLHLDPATDIQRLRAKFDELVARDELYDGRLPAKCLVTDTAHDHIEVRLTMSTATPADAFQIKCNVREAMLAFIREEMPEAIPRQRVEGENDAAAKAAAVSV